VLKIDFFTLYFDVLTSLTDLLYMLMYCWVRGTSSILKVTPVKLNCLAMYIPLSFMSMATISMAPTPLKMMGGKYTLGHFPHIIGITCFVACKKRNVPALNSLDKVAKFPEGCFKPPDAQAIHVGHISRFRGTLIEKSKFFRIQCLHR